MALRANGVRARALGHSLLWLIVIAVLSFGMRVSMIAKRIGSAVFTLTLDRLLFEHLRLLLIISYLAFAFSGL